MCDYGLDLLSTSGLPLGLGPSYVYMGKINSRTIVNNRNSPGYTFVGRNPFPNDPVSQLQVDFTNPWGSGNYIVFARETAVRGAWLPYQKDPNKGGNTSVLRDIGGGKLRLVGVLPNSWANDIHNTDFYVFRQLTPDMAPNYGMNIYNELGQLTFTTAGKLLSIAGVINKPSITTGGGVVDWPTQTLPTTSALLSTVGWQVFDGYSGMVGTHSCMVMSSGIVTWGFTSFGKLSSYKGKEIVSATQLMYIDITKYE